MKKFSMMVAALVLCSSAALAQTDDRYAVRAESVMIAAPGSVDVTISIDSVDGTLGAPLNVQGWSYGICSDASFAAVTGVVDAPLIATINGGNPAGFTNINVAPAGGDGFTGAIIIDFFGVNFLAPGAGYEVAIATYDVSSTTGTMPITICDSLGAPPVDTLVVEEGGVGQVPVFGHGEIAHDIVVPAGYVFKAAHVSSNTGSAAAAVTLDSVGGEDVDGFSFGLTHDAAIVTLDSIDQGSVVASTNGGSGADFFFANAAPALPAGVSGAGFVGCVISLTPPFEAIAVGADQEVAVFNYSVIGNDMDVSALEFSGDIGSPTVPVVISVDAATVLPTTEAGSVTVDGVIVVLTPFVRGDVNNDGLVDVTDVVFLAKWLFNVAGAAQGTCNDAGDINANGMLESLVDPLALLSYLFQGGVAPAAPFGACGTDANDDCVSSSCP